MKVLRKGAARDDGTTSITIPAQKLTWNESESSLTIACDDAIRNFTGDARHRYRVRLSLDELSEIVGWLGENCKDVERSKFENVFAPKLRALKRIEARAVGML